MTPTSRFSLATTFAFALTLAAGTAACGSGPAGAGSDPATPAGGDGVSPATIAAAQKKFPGATADSLAKGRATFEGKCAGCHPLPAPASESADEWPSIVQRMAPKAGLSQAEGDLVLQWVIAKGSEG